MITNEEHWGSYTLVTMSDIGSNHRAMLMPNQDFVGYCIDGEDFVIAVSDGVGSCCKADLGAICAVEVCTEIFKRLKNRASAFEDDAIAEELILSWCSALKGNSIDDCCTTLKAIIKIGNTAKLISIGDGFAAITSDGFEIISPSEKSGFTNETHCLSATTLPNDIWVRDFRLDLRKSYAMMCCTDGVANGIIDGKEIELVKDIETSTRSDELKSELESFLIEISKYCFDDRTVGVVKYEWKN